MSLTLASILTTDNLQQAWQKVAANRGAAGSDEIVIATFRHHLNAELALLQTDIDEGIYQPAPLRLVNIPKENNRIRQLAIPAIRDRVLQTALTRLWSPLLEREFSDTSFGYRPGRSVAAAVEQVQHLQRQGYNWVVDADIQQFFASIPHTLLMQLVGRYLKDNALLALIEQWLRSPMDDEQGLWCPITGIAMGSPLSPLLANLYLDHLDNTLDDAQLRLVRYADDFLVLCKSQHQAEQALKLTDTTLASLALNLHPEKTRIVRFDQGFDFLGVRFVDSLAVKAPVDRGDALPRSAADTSAFNTLYLNRQGCVVRLDGNRLIVVQGDEETQEIPALRLELIMLFGRINLTTPVLSYCLDNQISVAFCSRAGHLKGLLAGEPMASPERLAQQLALYEHPEARLAVARQLVSAKLHNSAVVLGQYQRNHPDERLQLARDQLKPARHQALAATGIEQLRGYEGAGARAYFEALPALTTGWDFSQRKKHPAPDPVNALLSFGYSLLLINIQALLQARGLHPYIGVYHQRRSGHPTLASDLMEQFRAPVVDRLVLKLINKGTLTPDDFYQDGNRCLLHDASRKRFLEAFEQRLQTIIQHPRDHKQLCYRRAIERQIDAFIAVLETPCSPYLPFEIR